MKPTANALVALATVLLVAACTRHDGPHDVRVTVDGMRGTYAVEILVEGYAPIANPQNRIVNSLEISLAYSKETWETTGACPVWSDLQMTLDGQPLTRCNAGGLLPLAPNVCAGAYFLFVFDDDVPWRDRDELVLRLEDPSGASEFHFENFIRPPTVTVVDPPDGIVHPGDALTLRFDPGIGVLRWIEMYQEDPSGIGNELQWANATMSDFAVGPTDARLTVPPGALVGLSNLRFDTGSDPRSFGWNAGVLVCDDATRCHVRRVAPGVSSCGIHEWPANALDDDAVRVPIQVVP